MLVGCLFVCLFQNYFCSHANNVVLSNWRRRRGSLGWDGMDYRILVGWDEISGAGVASAGVCLRVDVKVMCQSALAAIHQVWGKDELQMLRERYIMIDHESWFVIHDHICMIIVKSISGQPLIPWWNHVKSGSEGTNWSFFKCLLLQDTVVTKATQRSTTIVMGWDGIGRKGKGPPLWLWLGCQYQNDRNRRWALDVDMRLPWWEGGGCSKIVIGSFHIRHQSSVLSPSDIADHAPQCFQFSLRPTPQQSLRLVHCSKVVGFWRAM